MTQVANTGHYPVISGSASADNMSGISEYFQRLTPTDNYQAMVIKNKTTEYNISSVAIAYQLNDNYSTGLSGNFKNVYEGQIVAETGFVKDDPEIAAKINELLLNSPEAIFFSIVDADIYTELIKQLGLIYSRYDFSNTYFMFCDAMHSDNIFTVPLGILSSEINGNPQNFGAMPAPDTSTVTYKYFKNQLYQKYQQEVASFNAQFYDAGYLYALAIEQAICLADMGNMANFRGCG